MIRRLLVAAVLTATMIVLTAGPAWADPAEPTNYRSRINVLDPPPSGVAVEVVGGDAFLRVAVAEGHSVLVSGYFGEPYLRIDPDGQVFLNDMSPARYINQDRWGLSDLPDHVDAQANPVWVQIGSGGTFSWHDHRIHWMSKFLPPSVAGDRTEIVFPWTVSLFIDGVETEVRGELLWIPSANPAGPLLTGIVGVLPLLAWRPGRIRLIAIVATVVGVVGLTVAIAQFGATPGFDRGFPIAAVFPSLAVLAGIGALWVGRASIRTWTVIAVGGLALLFWAWSVRAAITAPVLPSQLPVGFERAAVALAAWVGLGILALATFETLRATSTDIDDSRGASA